MTGVSGKAAVVTGGGSGIGRALATALATEGASVVVADILEENARSVASEISRAGGSALAAVCDVSDRASVRDMKARANDSFGTISLLFSNAGVTSLEPMMEMSDDDYDWITHVNFFGASNCLRAFLPDMMAQRGGHVMATSSMVALTPSYLPCHVPYVAAKSGLVGMMLNLRVELSEYDIGCTVLCPGGVATGIGNTPRYRPARFGGPMDRPVKLSKSVAQTRKTIHFRPPEEVAEMVLDALRDNRPMVVTDASQRSIFVEELVDVAMAAFDAAEAYDRRG